MPKWHDDALQLLYKIGKTGQSINNATTGYCFLETQRHVTCTQWWAGKSDCSLWNRSLHRCESVSNPNCHGVFWMFFLRQIAIVWAFRTCFKANMWLLLLGMVPSAPECTSQHRVRWQKYAGGSCSSWGRLMWGSLKRSLREQVRDQNYYFPWCTVLFKENAIGTTA